MAPIQVVELTNIPPELRPDPEQTQSRIQTAQTRRYAKGQLNYYGYQRVGARATENWPWLVSWETLQLNQK